MAKTSMTFLLAILSGTGLLISTGCMGTTTETSVSRLPPADIETDTDTAVSESSDSDTDELPPLEEFEVSAPEPTADKVVTLGSGAKPGPVTAGSIVTIAVRVRIGKPWHIYAINKPTGVSIPTKLKLKLPAGITEIGEWDIPDPKEYEEDTFVYENNVVFRRQLKIASDASGLLDVGCEVKYQPCKDDSCMQPTSGTTTIALEVTSP